MIARDIGARDIEGRRCLNISAVHEKLGDLPSALDYAQQALAAFTAINSQLIPVAQSRLDTLRVLLNEPAPEEAVMDDTGSKTA